MAQYPKTKSIGSIGSIVFGMLEVQVRPTYFWDGKQPGFARPALGALLSLTKSEGSI